MRALVLSAVIIAASASAVPAMTLLENQLLACPIAANMQKHVGEEISRIAEVRARGLNSQADFLDHELEQQRYEADLMDEKCAIAQAEAARRARGGSPR
jgi:hypothetical protein